jgi:hypothetical protein
MAGIRRSARPWATESGAVARRDEADRLLGRLADQRFEVGFAASRTESWAKTTPNADHPPRVRPGLHTPGRVDQAETEYVRILSGRKRILGEAHPHTVATPHALAATTNAG